jgi:hypothetical protein
VAEPASAQTLHKLDALSLKERYSATMEGFSTTAASLPSLHDTIEASPPSSLSSSPIWKRRDFMWGITFYTTKDLRGYFHTFPHVGGPFDSKDEANKAIDRYLSDHEDLTMYGFCFCVYIFPSFHLSCSVCIVATKIFRHRHTAYMT